MDAQRKAFTSRLPKVKAESEASQYEQARKRSTAKVAENARGAPSSVKSSPVSIGDSATDRATDGVPDETDSEEGDGESKSTIDHLPMIFLDEDKEPEEGLNIYDVEGNLAAARAASAGGGDEPPLPPVPPQQQQQQQQRRDHGRESTLSTTPQRNADVSDSAVQAAVDSPVSASLPRPSPPPLRSQYNNNNKNARSGARADTAAAAATAATVRLPPKANSGAAGPTSADYGRRRGGGGGGGGEIVGRPDGARTAEAESRTVRSSTPDAADGGEEEQEDESIGARRFRVSAAAAVATRWNSAPGAGTGAGDVPPAISSIAVPPRSLNGRGVGGNADGETADTMAREAEEQTEMRQEEDEEEVLGGWGF